ncbi:hypothetical protein M569_16494, partial [Genlisea aurea]
KKPDQPLDQYLLQFKTVLDNLAAIGDVVPDNERVYCLLNSLGPSYDSFATSMLKDPRPTFRDLIPQLQSFEMRRQLNDEFQQQQFSTLNPMAYITEQRQRTNQPRFTSNRRGFQAQTRRPTDPTSPTPQTQNRDLPSSSQRRRMTPGERELYKNETCQICDVPGHIAKICWYLRGPQAAAVEEKLPPALANLTLDNSLTENEWTADTGATNHMAGKGSVLNNLKPYTGRDGVIIGDGSKLSISGIGATTLKQNNTQISLQNVLYVPKLTKNLLSISQLTSQQPINCEFTNNNFFVKDRATGHTQLIGHRKGDLYVLKHSPAAYFSTRFTSCSSDIWHQRLGHPQETMVHFLKNKGLIHVNQNGYRYYACLVDEFSRYMWFFPLRQKSDFALIFLQFEAYVHRQFDQKIKILQTDNGGEFVNRTLHTHFVKTGLIHHLSCPHTHEQLGMVERRHRTIREHGMTFLFHSGLPLNFWVEAFRTAVFTLNSLP